MSAPKDTTGKDDRPAAPSDKSGSRKTRRKGMSLLAYYLAGGAEHRYHPDRRSAAGSRTDPDRRSDSDRRQVVDTKYLNCGKVIDRRDMARRTADRVDPAFVERERFRRLGPGWL